MSNKSPEQKFNEAITKVSSYHFYNSLLKDFKPKHIPYKFISHIVVHFENGENLIVHKDMLLDETMSYYISDINLEVEKPEDKVKYVRTFINIPDLAKHAEAELKDIYQGRF